MVLTCYWFRFYLWGCFFFEKSFSYSYWCTCSFSEKYLELGTDFITRKDTKGKTCSMQIMCPCSLISLYCASYGLSCGPRLIFGGNKDDSDCADAVWTGCTSQNLLCLVMRLHWFQVFFFHCHFSLTLIYRVDTG